MTSSLLLASPGAGSAAQVDLIFWTLVVVSGLVALGLAALTLTYCVRYRAGAGRGAPLPAPSRVTLVEATWIGATLVAFLGIAVWSNLAFGAARAPVPGAYTVYVVGKQWMWKIEHPGGRREINELHVPAGEPVRLVLASADAIHSFYVPALRVKQDAVPGRYTSLSFTAPEPGVYHLFCAEYCGTEHSGMIGSVVVMPPEAFARWRSDHPLGGDTAGGTPRGPRGQTIFERLGCAACHERTERVRAPRLDGLWGRTTRLAGGGFALVDENYVRESILDPDARITAGYAARMPSYAGVLTEEDLARLVEFIRSLRSGWPDEGGGG